MRKVRVEEGTSGAAHDRPWVRALGSLLCEDGQAMVEYGAIAAALLLGLALAIKGLQIAMSQQLDHQHQALAGAP